MSGPADPDLRITTTEAAALCGVDSATIRSWRFRGLLHSVGVRQSAGKGGRERLYRLGDVIAAGADVQAGGQGPVRRGDRRARARDLVEPLPA